MDRVEAEAIYDAGREAVVEVLLRMDAQIGRLEERVARQDERIAQLERRLNRSSRNSSIPPSADPPANTLKRGKDPSGRKQGAQPGHEGRGRPLLLAWAVDEVINHWPERCGCGHFFAVGEHVPVGEPVRWQVEELPVISVQVTEHRCHRSRCPGCGEHPRGELPSEVAQSAFGPRFRRPSRRSRYATGSLAAMSLSVASNCSHRGSARARWTRSSTGPRRRWLSRTPICWERFVGRAR